EVLEHLLALRAHVVRADDRAVPVGGHLAGDVDGSDRAAHLDDVGVAGRPRQGRGVRALDMWRRSLRQRERRQRQRERREKEQRHRQRRANHRDPPMARPRSPPRSAPYYPPRRAGFGGVGRYSIITLLTTAIGRPGCENVVAGPLMPSTVTFSPSRL